VLLDGIPFNDPFGGWVYWSRVPLESTDRVEVVDGSSSSLYGNYAMGGVINVITHVPDHREAQLEAAGGSYGTYRASGHVAAPLSEGLRVGLDATSNGTSGYQAVDASIRAPIDVPTAFRARNVQMTAQFEVDPTLSGTVRAGYHDNHQRLYTRLSTNSQRQWNFSADATKRLGADSVTATVYRTDSRFLTDNTDTPSGVLPGLAEFIQNRHETPVNATGASLVWAHESASWLRRATFGGDYQQIHGTDFGAIFDDTGRRIRTDIGDGAQMFAGAFAQLELDPTEHVQVLASARYQYFRNYDGFDGYPGGAGAVAGTTDSGFDPRLSARYSLTSTIALRAAAYKAFRAPTLDNLFRAFSTPFGIFFGNPDLKPERLTGGEAGIDVTTQAVRAQLTFYRNTIDSLLTSRTLGPAELPPGFFFGSRNINAGSARAQGAELEIHYAVTERIDAGFAYALADSTITANPLDAGSVGRQLGGVPRQSASASLDYGSGRNGFRGAARLRWLKKSYSDNDHTLAVDSQFIVDLSVSYSLRGRAEPFLQIQNLFDRRYVADNSGFSAPQLGTPLTVLAGMRLQLD